MGMILPQDKVLIVGAGCFGLSTAHHLLMRGYTDITIIDRSPVLPAPDAASTDINKIVRSSYFDPLYASLAREAVAAWKDTALWGDAYHESGVLLLGAHPAPAPAAPTGAGAAPAPPAGGPHIAAPLYADAAYANDVALGARVEPLPTPAALRGAFPPGVRTAEFAGSQGYLNRDGGWAAASQGIDVLLADAVARGARVLPGKSAAALIQDDGRTVGVRCTDGEELRADLVVLATGAWTAGVFPTLGLAEKCLATGQTIAKIQLTEEEATAYASCPVVLDFDTGFYIFPPTKEGVVKLAIHAAGYTNTHDGTSIPRTAPSGDGDGLRVPRDALRALRERLREVYPDLAEKPFTGTRLCWYTDSPDEDWIIGPYPRDAGLVLATAGSGHAFKFLPVIGRLVADVIEGTLSPALAQKFSVEREHMHTTQSRAHPTPQELDPAELCSPDDLLPHL